MKICSKCNIEKSLDFYHVRLNGKQGRHSICKPCRSAQSIAWGKTNPDKSRKIQREHKRKLRSTDAGKKALYIANAKYYKNNRGVVNEYYRRKRSEDPLFALTQRYRSRLSKAIRGKGFTKAGGSIDTIGCTWDQFKTHMEKQFVKGMSWGLFLSGNIHVDHITPIASAKTEKDLIALNHYTNLRPLWAKENLSKGAKQEVLI